MGISNKWCKFERNQAIGHLKFINLSSLYHIVSLLLLIVKVHCENCHNFIGQLVKL